MIGGWRYLGGGAASCVCARSECPEIRMSPRILVAIKRRPAVSPSAYGTECRWRLEKTILWNAGNAVCTGSKATLPPPPSADSSPPSPSVHTRTTPPAPGLSWASPVSPRPCPALLPQGLFPGHPREGATWAVPSSWGAPASPGEHRSPAAPAPGKTHSPALSLGTVYGHRGQDRDGHRPPGLVGP